LGPHREVDRRCIPQAPLDPGATPDLRPTGAKSRRRHGPRSRHRLIGADRLVDTSNRPAKAAASSRCISTMIDSRRRSTMSERSKSP